ncbi:hypothetical protein HG537_0B05030 [Torulaspora globosa]|uniref:DNA-directed RNA polymerase III subunit RPC4 n=1 Tax=Torulaspora globosa TaxID=48254 RepID=A0A7H9HS07_9SACH|nr:hypothetical protein HG537_0B05030 [Torulaspora sp. CBS 2947]
MRYLEERYIKEDKAGKMSSGSGSGRLPSLNSSGGKPSLKFKPKAVARRTKEERDASAPKIKTEEISRPYNDKKNNQGKSTATANKQRRMARFLSNTRVISSGPLAAGNFVSEKGSDMRRGFIKSEGGTSSLVHSGLQNIEGGETNSDDEELDAEHGAKNKSKFNMGREYAVHEIDDDNDYESDEIGEMDEEALQAKRVEELFPVRPVRIRHEDIEVVKIEESISDATTREATPAVKTEEVGSELQQGLEQRQANLQDRLKELSLESQFQSLDQNETLQEMKSLINDHLLIAKKLNKINNKPSRFILFQLPSKLPEFEEIAPKTEQEPVETGTKEESDKKSEPIKPSEDSLTGKIGSIRIHRSGKLSVKIGNVIMDISKGADTAFMQDVVAINESGETPCLENLGRIDGRVVVTPRF